MRCTIKKSKYLGDIKRVLGFIEGCEHAMRFWFEVRHTWESDGGYECTRRMFLMNRKSRKFFQKALAEWNQRLIEESERPDQELVDVFADRYYTEE